MSRAQFALNVDDIDEAGSCCIALFGIEPAKGKPGYANVAIASRRSSRYCWRTPARGAASSPAASGVDLRRPRACGPAYGGRTSQGTARH